jgi:hypothetical protein
LFRWQAGTYLPSGVYPANNVPESLLFKQILMMKKRPVTVILVAVLFMLAGLIGFIYHFKDFFTPGNNPGEIVWVLLIRILAVLCGILLYLGYKWARWLAMAWLLYHVILSAFHSTSELITHLILLILVAVLLFLPVSTRFFTRESDFDNINH